MKLQATREAARAVAAVRRTSDSVVARVNRLGFPYRRPTTPHSVEPRPDKRHTGPDYDATWARKEPVRLARAAIIEGPMRLMVKVVGAPERFGLDRLNDLAERTDADGVALPVIFAANHHSHLDTPLLLTSIPEPWRHRVVVAAAADYFFKTWAGGTVSALTLGAFPIDRSKVSRRSIEEVADLLRDGWSLVIFPEGGRSPDGWAQPFKAGAALIAQRAGVPLVPVHLEGTGRVLRKGKNRPQRSITTVTFGPPILPDAAPDSRRLNTTLERAVAQLGDEAATDWWSARRRAADSATPALGGPGLPSWRRAWALGDRSPRRRKRPTWPDLG